MGASQVGTVAFGAAYVAGLCATALIPDRQERTGTLLTAGGVGGATALGLAGLGAASAELGVSSLRFAESVPARIGAGLLGGAAVGVLTVALFDRVLS